ncbi:hypothetical protein LEP1GSC137_2276 [Leptospira borgpetersenii str. Noumea 25]|uniref:Uncharacterized protein n=2 Tax=Leptospira borgpetersenii TaxID=174 RepID=M3H594_LEPBO|nr:hypothetical protein LEP1GSC123_0852 [Leptospira borgpetersenii str. 200701203]EMN16173.1 hypothetical protein LEP1GSC056_0913 [Leptospira borgpetersenii str. Brem 328]EMO09427.1 hypothetical protein LEP1GSC137_2276 [Leptospira borgpetersenii str. Noumea 25]
MKMALAQIPKDKKLSIILIEAFNFVRRITQIFFSTKATGSA